MSHIDTLRTRAADARSRAAKHASDPRAARAYTALAAKLDAQIVRISGAVEAATPKRKRGGKRK